LFISLRAEFRLRIRAFDPTNVFFMADVGDGPIIDRR